MRSQEERSEEEARSETRRYEKRRSERKGQTEADSLVKVGGAWHAWRRKHKAWFERVSTLSSVGPDTSALRLVYTVLVPVRGCPHVLRHASITRTAPRRAAPKARRKEADDARRKEKMEGEEVRG